MPTKFKDGQLVTAKVYCLKSNGEPFYVGCTSGTLESRLRNHITFSSRITPKTPIAMFILTNKDITIELIEEIEYVFDSRIRHGIALLLETYWIKKYKSEGHALLNKNKTKENESNLPERKLEERVSVEAHLSAAYRHNITLSQNLILERKKKRLSRQALSDIVGIDLAYITLYEEGTLEPTYSTSLKFCEVFGINSVKELYKERLINNKIAA